MKVLVTGGDGFIGSWLHRELGALGGITVAGMDLQVSPWNVDLQLTVLDLCDRSGVERLLEKEQPDVIVLNGAIKVLDTCERNARALNVNVFSQAPFLEYALRRNTHVIFISSDMAFGGCTRPPYAEGDPVAANNAYGAMKIACEQLARTMETWTIVRTALVYGPMCSGEKKKLLPILQGDNLTNQSHLIHWSCARSACGLKVPLAENVFCTPTYIGDLVRGLGRIVEGRRTGVFHCAGSDRISRFEMGRRAAAYGGRPDCLTAFKAEPDELRPMEVSLDGRWTMDTLGMTPTPIDVGIRLSLAV